MLLPNFELHPPLILVVDDDPVSRQVICMMMKKQGYRVAALSDGQQCLENCKYLKPNMILLDAIMPKVNGFTCCAQLQEEFGEDCPPILMITALDDPESVDRAFKVGATDYITKPIHWPVMRQRVRRLLQTRWAMQELKKQVERARLLTEKLETVNQQLQQLATWDDLTQIANRRCFDSYLEQEWKRLAREQLPMSLILCDVDFFKAYNDTYGHPQGDQCLKQVAQAIHHNVKRSGDLAARYGGEEFAVILLNTPQKGALKVAEDIRRGVKALKLEHTGSKINSVVTLSLGVASLVPHHQLSEDLLVAMADQALYEAKKSGRDRVASLTMK